MSAVIPMSPILVCPMLMSTEVLFSEQGIVRGMQARRGSSMVRQYCVSCGVCRPDEVAILMHWHVCAVVFRAARTCLVSVRVFASMGWDRRPKVIVTYGLPLFRVCSYVFSPTL